MKSWLTVLFLLAVACVAAFAWKWLAADPGYLLIRYGQTSIETTLIFAVVAAVFVLLALRLVWRLLRAPGAAWARSRRRRGRERIAGGLVALAEGRHAHALRELERASHQTGLQAPALLAAAQAAQARGDDERANALLARSPGAAALVLRARFEWERRGAVAALALLKPAAEKNDLPPAGWQLLAEAALAAGEPSTALAALPAVARAQSLAPPAFAALEARVLAAAVAAAADRDALNALWSAMTRAQRRVAEALVAYARRSAELGQMLAGMSELEAALRRQWSEPLIVAYGELGPAEAEARLHQAEGWIVAQPTSAGLALTLGRLCIQCELWGKARGYLERGLQLAPSAPLWEALGDCHAGRGDQAAAALCWRNALLAGRGEATDDLPVTASATALSTRAAVVEERSEHGVPRLPGLVQR